MYAWLAVFAIASCGRFGFDAARVARDAPDDVAAGALDTGAPPDAYVAPNVAFVSTTTQTGNLGGLARADTICQDDATAASLSGTFVAFVWNAGVDPTTRLAGARGWVDVEGRPIAEDASDFLSGMTIYPIQYNAAGVLEHQWFSWQGSSTVDCTGWTDGTSGVGTVAITSSDDTVATQTYSGCSTPNHLLCLEAARFAQVAVPQESGRIAFVTTSLWGPGGGLSVADATCATEAQSAGLPGTYVAMLPTDTATAASRFDLAGLPWRRVDGVRMTQTANDWFDATNVPYFDTFLARTATGAASLVRPWTGTDAAGTCASWTTSSSSSSASTGVSFSSQRASFDHLFDFSCSSMTNLVCLQM